VQQLIKNIIFFVFNLEVILS